MEKVYFKKNADIEAVKKLCKKPIQQRRGKQVCEQILREIDSGYLEQSTKDWLSKWVNPGRKEKVQPIFEEICVELFGYKIGRTYHE